MCQKYGVTRGQNINFLATTEKKGTSRRQLRPRTAAVMRSVKAGLLFPVGRIGRYLKDAQRVGNGAPFYLAVVLEYLAAEALELTGNTAKDSKKSRIIPRHLMIGFTSDEEFKKLLVGVTITHGGVVPVHSVLIPKAKKAAKWPKKTSQSPKKVLCLHFG